eukprot:gene20871-23701_t
MLDATLKTQLKTYLEKVVQPIEIVATLDDSAKAREMQALLADIVVLSDKITLVEKTEGDVRKPSFAITRPGTDIAVTFAGIPMGHEFTSLVLALLQVGGHTIKFDDAVIEQIRNLDGDFHFETFISLTCHNCPEVVQALNAMSVINPRIKVTTIDGGVFPKEVEERQIMAVPMMFLNGEHFGQGRSSVEEILAKLDTNAGARQAAELSKKDVFDVLIVGGGPAGAAAAIYAARKGIKTGVVSERFGGQVLYPLVIENFISVTETDGPKFAVALEQHVKAYEVDIMNTQRAAQLTPGKLVEVTTASGAVLKSKTVILATGARWREINVPGEKEYRNHGVAYCPHCDGPLFKGKRVAVIGGGNSGVEAAIDLAGLGKHFIGAAFFNRNLAQAVVHAPVDGGAGQGDVEADVVVIGGQGFEVGAYLVGGVATRGHAVGAHQAQGHTIQRGDVDLRRLRPDRRTTRGDPANKTGHKNLEDAGNAFKEHSTTALELARDHPANL